MRNRLAPLCAFVLAGCTVSPTVDYHLLSDKDYNDTWIPYQLTDSTLVIGINLSSSNGGGQPTSPDGRTPAGKPGTNGKPSGTSGSSGGADPSAQASAPGDQSTSPSGALIQPLYHEELRPVSLVPYIAKCIDTGCYGDTISMAAVPIAYEGETFGIEPVAHWLVVTHLAPTYFQNSLRLQSLEVSVEDKRQEAIDTLGAIAVGTARTFGTGGAGAKSLLEGPAPKPQILRLPIVIDLADAKDAQQVPRDLPDNTGWKYQLKFLDDPMATGFKTRAAVPDVHGAILTSLCRPVVVTLSAPDGVTKLALGVTVADPDYILPIPMPPTGTVSFGTLCGASVNMGTAVAVKANQVATSFFNDVDQIRNALKRPGPSSH